MPVIDIAKEAISTFAAGDGTIGTTPGKLTPGGQVNKHVVVRANAGNTSVIMVGTSALAAPNGFVLAAGEQTPPIYVDDLGKIWLVGGAAAQGFSWIAS